MPMIDFGLLIKVMGRTQSSHDPEILVAIKKANEMLTKAGLQWHQVIHGIGNGREFEADFNTDALHRAAEAARARNFTEGLRAKQAQRDAAYSAMSEAGYSSTGWTEKGPFGYDGRVYSKSAPPEPPGPMSDEQIEDDARVMTEQIEGEAPQTNWFVFAMVEPEIARWLFDKRASHAFHRILFAQVCEHGELGDNQIQVCRHMMNQMAR